MPTAPEYTPYPSPRSPRARRALRIGASLAAALALGVILFGAFVRLSNAGLSCPDWPTCYGKATWPRAPSEGIDHVATLIRAVDPTRAWREQLHRHLAGTLGLLGLGLALGAARAHRRGIALIVGAAALVGLTIPLTMRGLGAPAALGALTAEILLVGAAWRWRRDPLAQLATLCLALIVFQALLGMWTVTWLLKPIVVMGHLLGGLGVFALLLTLATRARARPIVVAAGSPMRRALLLGLGLLALQVALGGWTSANYAALACGQDFPTCLGQWSPRADFAEAFVLWRGVGVDYEGGVLDGPARVAIQLAHRAVAVILVGYVYWLGWRMRRWVGGSVPWLLIALASLQAGLGVANVLSGLPIAVALSHTAGAALLLAAFVSLLARLPRPAGGWEDAQSEL